MGSPSTEATTATYLKLEDIVDVVEFLLVPIENQCLSVKSSMADTISIKSMPMGDPQAPMTNGLEVQNGAIVFPIVPQENYPTWH